MNEPFRSASGTVYTRLKRSFADGERKSTNAGPHVFRGYIRYPHGF